jgi:hypothetical protein
LKYAGGLRGPAARQTPFQTPQCDAAVDARQTTIASATDRSMCRICRYAGQFIY